MKIKHFQGYGSVNAVKKSLNKGFGENGDMTQLVVEVSGDHEYGLLTNTAQDAFDWLVKYFDKQAKSSSRSTCNFGYKWRYINGVESCQYILIYKT